MLDTVGGDVYYLRSAGAGRSFASPVTVYSGKNIAKVFAADVSGDGYDDLVAIDNAHHFYVSIASQSSGTSVPFAAPSSHGFTYESKGEGDSYGVQDLTFGDFNGDGLLDLAFATMDLVARNSSSDDDNGSETTTFYYTGNYAIALNQGGGSFPANPTILDTWADAHGEDGSEILDDLLSRVTAGDFNGDGHVDLAFGYHTLVEWLTAPDTKVLAGDGSGSFDATDAIGTGHGGCEDVDGFIATGSAVGQVPPPGEKAYLAIAFTSETHVVDYASNWSISTDQELDKTPRGPLGGAGDYNFDGEADLMFLDGHSSQLTVGIDWSSWSQDLRHDEGLHLGTDIQRGDGGDFDGDGSLDIVGTDGDNFNVYFNETVSAEILFYKDNDCEGDYIGSVSGLTSASYDLTASDPPVRNDQARSMKLTGLSSEVTITLYDSPSGDTSDDWATVVTLTTVDSTCVGTFETTTTTSTYSETFHEHTGHSISVNDLDGKVSRIVVAVP